ncbi:MAG: carbohydrate-binding domain-containing protein [Muribaculaceae bacterium]|nr:carbohydrate-binding domain-containing protein [Muribaculaceae bacterium]
MKLADNITLGVSTEVIDSVKYDAAGQNILLVTKNDTTGTLARSSITKLTVGDGTDDVEINFVGDDAEIINPYAFEGVEVTKDGADVVVKSTTDLELRYRITGTTTTGQVKIYSDKRFTLALDGANITNNDGSAINIQSKKKITVELVDGTTTNLVDASKYTKTPADEDEKACFFSEGQLVFTGNGTLNVTGNKKHAIASDDYVRIDSGTINIVSSKSDGLHANDYFLMKGGIFRSAASAGDGIDADAGYIVIDDGLIDVTVATADTKAVKADSIITINGGTLNLTVSGDQAKGIKSKHNIFINGGKITSNVTGKVVVTEGDPSYATAIKTDRNITITEGEIDITATGEAAKGISVDSVATVSGGTIKIVASGANGSYTDAEGQPDTYSSTAFSVDCETNISGGTLDITAGGNDGKGINSDKDVTISGGTIKLTVSGNQAKGIKTKNKFTMIAGTITGTMTGNVVVEDGDASYCTGIKVKKALLASGGSINFTASGVAAKGISADADATFNGTNVTITASGGYGTYTNTSGVTDDYSSAAIKVDGSATFSAGTVDVTAGYFAAKGISTDANVIINGGTVKVTATGVKSKGMKVDGTLTVTSGTVTGTTSGSAYVENYDPSYCTAIKVKGDINISGGTFNITGSGAANKGISGDANATFNGGSFTIRETGNGGTYRDTATTIDGLSSTCITIDGNLNMIGGTYNLTNTGTAGKCIKVDGIAYFGNASQGPNITATTSGAKISKSSVTWSNPSAPTTPTDPTDPTTGGVLEKVMEVTSGVTYSGYGGRFSTGYGDYIYLTDNANGQIIRYSKAGVKSVFANIDAPSVGLSSDDAGNILVNKGFPSATQATSWVIIEPNGTQHALTLTFPSGVTAARIDAPGRVVGDVMSSTGGYLYLAVSGASNVAAFKIVNGAQSGTASTASTSLTFDATTVVQPRYTTVAATAALSNPAMGCMVRMRSDMHVRGWWQTSFVDYGTSPNPRSCEGFDVFTLNGKTYLVEPNTTANYASGFSIREVGTTDPVATYGDVLYAGTAQRYQGITARVDGSVAYIYQNVSNTAVGIYKFNPSASSSSAIDAEPAQPKEGPGGPGGNQKYANPKVIKAVGNLYVYNGTLTLTSTQDGGEALESKAVLTINGGTVKCSTVDDGINAKTSLVINGGQVYCNASNNDAIDSNGTMTITGGIVIALGALAPEEGLDCDNNAFSITGGTVIGIGSGNSTVTNKGSNQTFVTLNQTLAQGASLSYTTSGGGHFKFTNPRSYTGSGGGPGGGSGSSRLGILISYPKNATSTGTYTTYFSCLQLDY